MVIASSAATEGGIASALCFCGIDCFLRAVHGARLFEAPTVLVPDARVRSGTGTSTGFVGIRIGSVVDLTGGEGLVGIVATWIPCLRSAFTPSLLGVLRLEVVFSSNHAESLGGEEEYLKERGTSILPTTVIMWPGPREGRGQRRVRGGAC